MRHLPPVLAMTFAALMLCFPETALTAAQSALHTWATAAAPALFPYMALMPLMTDAAAASLYETLFGRWMPRLLKLPGAAAPALAIAMTAGSPAGAAAIVRIGRSAALSRAEAERMVLCTCGFSPAFLITGIGAALLKSPADGRILLTAQLLTQLTLLLTTRFIRPDVPLTPVPPPDGGDSVRSAVLNTLAVGGYMTLFAVAGALLTRGLPPKPAALLQSLIDLPTGIRALIRFPAPRAVRLMTLAALTGWGGFCSAAQNLTVCRAFGLRRGKYFAAKAVHCALMTAFTALQMRLVRPRGEEICPAAAFSSMICGVISLIFLIFRGKNLFLNKENLHHAP